MVSTGSYDNTSYIVSRNHSICMYWKRKRIRVWKGWVCWMVRCWMLTIKSMLLFHSKGVMNVAVDGKSALLAINVPKYEVEKQQMRYIGWKTNKPTNQQFVIYSFFLFFFQFFVKELVNIFGLFSISTSSSSLPRCANDIRRKVAFYFLSLSFTAAPNFRA